MLTVLYIAQQPVELRPIRCGSTHTFIDVDNIKLTSDIANLTWYARDLHLGVMLPLCSDLLITAAHVVTDPDLRGSNAISI